MCDACGRMYHSIQQVLVRHMVGSDENNIVWLVPVAQVCVCDACGRGIPPYSRCQQDMQKHLVRTCNLARSCSTGVCVMPVADVSLYTAGAAMSTFSSGRFEVLKWYKCVCVCVCGRNELDVCTTLAYSHISLFRTMSVLYTSTRPHPFSNHLRIANQRG